MPATGATHKEAGEQRESEGRAPGSARDCNDAAAWFQQRSFCRGCAAMVVATYMPLGRLQPAPDDLGPQASSGFSEPG
jgi:hypothetical protein